MVPIIVLPHTDYFVRWQQTLHYNFSCQLTRNDGAPEEEVVFTIQQYATQINDLTPPGVPVFAGNCLNWDWGRLLGLMGLKKMMSGTDYFVRWQQTLHYNISFQLTRNDGAPEEEVVFTIQQYATQINDLTPRSPRLCGKLSELGLGGLLGLMGLKK